MEVERVENPLRGDGARSESLHHGSGGLPRTEDDVPSEPGLRLTTFMLNQDGSFLHGLWLPEPSKGCWLEVHKSCTDV